MKRIFFLVLLGGSIGQSVVKAQAPNNTKNHPVTVTVPDVALLALASSGSTNFTLALNAPTQAGEPLTAPSTSSSIWLNYSSTVASSGETSRSISAQITSGYVPSGTDLTVAVSQDNGGGAGQVGTRVSIDPIPITSTLSPIITNIGSCYTGKGTNRGHQLTFTLAILPGSYSTIRYGSNTVQVTYTLSDI
ncbi:hypothetical protein FHS57_000277 [Runella defluvii]|uniref:Uncharacterized protein n=1 Tax=Runella defluvii TaxID=370973 RepID=A0A7W6EN83_9BACT|nr:hypothetical protein [Runella defluvii]MBB3836295.1 hypothetical protein [Runella defluvii]